MATRLLLGCPTRPIPSSSTGDHGRRSNSGGSSGAKRLAGFGNGFARRINVFARPGKLPVENTKLEALVPHRCEKEIFQSRLNFARVEVRWTLPAAKFHLARPFLLGGVVTGLTMVSVVVASLARRYKKVELPSPDRAAGTEKLDFEEVIEHIDAAVSDYQEERIATIRAMARQAVLDDSTSSNAAIDDPNGAAAAATAAAVAAAPRLAIAARSQQEVSSPDFVELARQLDYIRESGMPEQEKILPESSSSGVVVINGKGTVRELESGRRSRFITTYEEACEVLRSDKHDEEENSPSTSEASSLPQSLDHSSSIPDDGVEVLENKSAASSRDDAAALQDLQILRYILLKAQENERKKKPLFQGMPPDAKDILFKGLERELGAEAEPIKDWILERIATDARQRPREDENDDPLPTITGRKKNAEWEPDCNPQKTVVTGSRSGAVKQKPASSDQPETKNKDAKNSKKKKKVWPKEIQRRYDSETDPKMRKLLKEIGKDLDEWLTEEEVEETLRLFFQGPDGQRELLRRWHEELKEEARKQGEVLGDEEIKRFDRMQEKYKSRSLQSLASKYRKPPKPDTLWWLKLRYVACVMLHNEEQKVSPGLYSMNMALENESEVKLHVVGFEDHNEALNFCRTLVPEIDKLGGATGARVIPFEPRELLREAKESEFEVTVLKKGQVENYAGKPLEEVEYRILEIGRDVYVQERLRERSIDVKSMMSDLWNDDL